MSELKPCPFCGGDSEIKDDGYWNVEFDNLTMAETDCDIKSPDMYWAECEACHSLSGYYETEEEAVDAWNRRIMTDAQQRAQDLTDTLARKCPHLSTEARQTIVEGMAANWQASENMTPEERRERMREALK